MEVRLTPNQEAFVRQAIESGRLHRPEDAVEQALSLWEERERERAVFLASLEIAKAAAARGEGRIITQQSMRELSEDVSRRGDEIWLYVARETGSLEVATRLIDSVTDTFLLLARRPLLGRSRRDDFGGGIPKPRAARICDCLLHRGRMCCHFARGSWAS
jgi:Arc/MetJ-type ribon-helix-helix transcriptional regulator